MRAMAREHSLGPMIRRLAIALSLVVLAVVPFLGGSKARFIGDDVVIIQRHEGLRAGSRPQRLFVETYWREFGGGGLYRPLTLVSFWLDRVVWGADAGGAPRPRGVWLSNLLLNAVAALLLFALLRQRSTDPLAAWLGAALFAVHPAHVEAVVHLVGRADLLAAVLFLAALLLHARPGRAARSGAVLCYLASLLAKESGVALPGILLLEAWLLAPGGASRASLSRSLRDVLPYLGVLGAYLLVRGSVLGASLDPPRAWILAVPGRYLAFEDPELLEVPLTMLHAFGEYLLLLVAPLWLSADYSGFPHDTGIDAAVLLSALAWGCVVAGVAWLWRRGRREPAAWLGFFLWTMLPVSNLAVRSGIVMAERTLYLPSIAACGLAAWGLSRARPHRTVWLALAAAFLAFFVARTVLRVPVWRDPLTLYEVTVEEGRFAGHVALNGLVGAYREELERRPDPELRRRAVLRARQAVEGFPSHDNVMAYSRFLLEQGDVEESLRAWELLLARSPRHPRYRGTVRRHLEVLLVRARERGDEPAARRFAARLAALDPRHTLLQEQAGDAAEDSR